MEAALAPAVTNSRRSRTSRCRATATRVLRRTRCCTRLSARRAGKRSRRDPGGPFSSEQQHCFALETDRLGDRVAADLAGQVERLPAVLSWHRGRQVPNGRVERSPTRLEAPLQRDAAGQPGVARQAADPDVRHSQDEHHDRQQPGHFGRSPPSLPRRSAHRLRAALLRPRIVHNIRSHTKRRGHGLGEAWPATGVRATCDVAPCGACPAADRGDCPGFG